MLHRAPTVISAAAVATSFLAACAGPQTAVTPIYQDQTYTKYGSGAEDNGLAGCVHGKGTMQSGTLICPGF